MLWAAPSEPPVQKTTTHWKVTHGWFMSEDTTGKQKTQFPLTHLAGELLAFVEMANAMLEARDLNQVLDAITREVGRIIEFDRSSVAILSADKKTLVLQNIHKFGHSAG
jgi:hypothetical protein